MDTPRIILEGHFMTYKTSIGLLWGRDHDVTYISGDWNTRLGCPLWGYPTFPSRRKIRKACGDIVSFMELFPKQTFFVDRFHISQQYYDKVFDTHYYDDDIEKRLAQMNTVIIYLRNEFDNYEVALESRKDNMHDHMVKYPKTLDEYRLQERCFEETLRQTKLPYVEYDVTSKNIEEITKDLEVIIRNL